MLSFLSQLFNASELHLLKLFFFLLSNLFKLFHPLFFKEKVITAFQCKYVIVSQSLPNTSPSLKTFINATIYDDK